MINFAALKIELQTDPQSIGYAVHIASGNHNAIAAALNLANIPSKRTVQTSALVQYLSDNGLLAGIADAAEDATNPSHSAARKAVATLRLARELGVDSINFERAANVALITGLVSAGLVTTQQASGVRALADSMQSRAEQLFGQDISHDDVQRALRV